jgi:hypothetical protein
MTESKPERVVKSVVIDRLDLTAATDCRDERPDEETEEIIARYAEAMGNGDDFPLPVVFDDGTVLRLADGKKRLLAAKRIGRKDIRAEIHVGGLKEAVLYAAGANLTHGVVSSRADKRRAVAALLRVASELSDREIGRKCGVDHKTVAAVRGELTGEIPQSSLRTGADGRTIDVSGIGARPAADQPDSVEPREIARARRNGTIPHGTTSEITEVNGDVAEETIPTPEPVFDRAKYLDQFPIRERLGKNQLALFDAEAIVYHAIEGPRNEFIMKHTAPAIAKEDKALHKIGPYSARIRYALKQPDPSRWVLCESCQGTGSVEMMGKAIPCNDCKEDGFHVRGH